MTRQPQNIKRKISFLAGLSLLTLFSLTSFGDVVIDYDTCPEYWSWDNKPMPNSFVWQNFEYVNLNCNIGYGYPGTAGRALGCNNSYGDYYWIKSKIGSVLIKGMYLRSWLASTNNCKKKVIITGYNGGSQVGSTTITCTDYASYKWLTLNWTVDSLYITGDPNSGGNNGVSLDIDNLTYSSNAAPVITEGASVSVTMDEDKSPTAFSKTLHATDSDGTNLSWSITSNPSHGTASISNGVLAYTPAANYNGSDSFVVKVADPFGATASCTVNITINPQPDAPVAVTDNAYTDEDTATIINVIANDYDPDGTTPVLLSVATPLHGTASMVSGQIIYTPARNFNGSDSFQYTIKDSTNLQATGQINVTIYPVDDIPPIISLSAATVSENQPLGTVIGTVAVDNPDTGVTYTFSLPSGTGNNNLFLVSGNQLKTNTYFDYETLQSCTITVQVDDGAGGITQKSFPITITNVNEAPTAVALSNTSISENMPSGTAVGTLSATDPDAGDTFTYSLVNSGNSFYIDGNQLKTSLAFDYEAQNCFAIDVKVTDAGGLSSVQSFTISITDANDAPTEIALSNVTVMKKSAANTRIGGLKTIDQDAGDSFTFSLAAGDGDTDNSLFTVSSDQLLTSSLFTASDKGSLSIRIQVTDSAGASFTKGFTINAPAPNIPPIAKNLFFDTTRNVVANINVTASNSDPDGDPLTITKVTQGGDFEVFGTAVIDQSGQTIIYTPNLDVTGSETFEYTISDGRGGEASAYVTVNINAESMSGFPFISVVVPKEVYGVVNKPLVLTAIPTGGDGSYLVEWAIKSQPDGANDAASLTTPKSDTTQFTPSKTGQYVLTVTANDEVQEPVVQDVTVTVYNPLSVDAGENQTAPIGRTVALEAIIQGGTGNYKITWSILSGPDTNPDQIPDSESGSLNLRLVNVGTYQFQVSVTDGIQPAVTDTVTITVTSDSPINSWQLY